MAMFKAIIGMFSGNSSGEEASHGDAVEHEGFTIVATPVREGSQFRLAGIISKEVDGERLEHRLIRADLFPSADQCAEFTVTKAKQVIKEQGERMFR